MVEGSGMERHGTERNETCVRWREEAILNGRTCVVFGSSLLVVQ